MRNKWAMPWAYSSVPDNKTAEETGKLHQLPKDTLVCSFHLLEGEKEINSLQCLSNKLSTHESFSYLEWESTVLMSQNENELYASHICLYTNELMLLSVISAIENHSGISHPHLHPPVFWSEWSTYRLGWFALLARCVSFIQDDKEAKVRELWLDRIFVHFTLLLPLPLAFALLNYNCAISSLRKRGE